MKIVIIEDEMFAARRLENMIHEYNPEIEIAATLESVKDSIAWFRSNTEPDLIFLDIHLEPDLTLGIDRCLEQNGDVFNLLALKRIFPGLFVGD